MTLSPRAQAWVDALPPGVDEWAQAQVARARHLTDDEARRLAGLLGLRPADTRPVISSGNATPRNVATPAEHRNGVATPKNSATPSRAAHAAPAEAFTAEFHQAEDEPPTGLAALLHYHPADTPDRVTGGQ